MLYCDPNQSEGFLAEIGKEGFVDNYPVELKNKDGTPLMISASSHYYYDTSGNILGVEGILRDIFSSAAFFSSSSATDWGICL